MRQIPAALLALSLAASPVSAATSSMRLTFIIPVSCSVDLVNSTMQGDQLVLEVRRSCNTFHSLTFSGNYDAALGDLTFQHTGGATSVVGDSVSIFQAERYYDGMDTIVVQSSSHDQAALAQYAQSINVSIAAS